MKCLFMLMAVVGLLGPGNARAGDGLDVKAWLARPGVRMLAVELYATYCKPCMEAVPHWKKLHEKYRDQGLRLVVIAVQDPEGICKNPGWNPDDMVCDSEGHIAQALGAGDELPAAFLWSWRGTLLVRKGHVGEVEAAVERELAALPRVTLGEKIDGRVRPLLRSELSRTDKVTVLADAAEQEALAAIRAESNKVNYADKTSCKLGEQIAPNSLLKAELVDSGRATKLMLTMYSAQTGCLSGSASVYWNEDRPDVAVAEAVTKLVDSLRVAVEMPGTAVKTAVKETEIGEKEEEWSLSVDTGVLVAFDSEPRGAVVLLDGKLLCQQTPCSKTVASGLHKVEMQKEQYLAKLESLRLNTSNRAVSWKLVPDFGWISVRSEPAGLGVTIDGKAAGTTPLNRKQVAAGPHQVLVTDQRYFDKGKQVQIERGEYEEVELALKPRQGGVVVKARDRAGNDLEADVYVDGVKAGATPLVQQVIVGQHTVVVQADGKRWEKTVEVREKQVESLLAELAVGATNRDRKGAGHPITNRDRKGAGEEPFYLGATLSEGLVFLDGEAFRTNFAGHLSAQLRLAKWLRWEIVSGGVALEKPNGWTASTAALFDAASWFFKAGPAFGGADGKTYWGVLMGLGHAFSLGAGWYLDAGLEARVWPGDASAVPVEANVGVRYGM